MAILVALALLVPSGGRGGAGVEGAGDDPLDLPSLWDHGSEPAPFENQFVAVEAFVVRTVFDSGLGIEEALGGGGDLMLGWDFRKPTRIGLTLGFAGWNTENDEDQVTAAGVRVRQYRVGFAVDFEVHVLELGLAATGGAYRFTRSGESDTSPFVEFEGSIGFRPIPALKLGVLGMTTYTQSSFNRSHTHLFHNYSGGLAVEVRF